MVKEVKNLVELRAVAEGFLRDIASRAPQENATVVGLSGDLGAGKTAFVKCVAAALGITEVVTSPTFILEKIYIIPRGSLVGDRFLKLIHIDAYRLHSGDEMRALEWEAILADETNLIFLEWPEQVADAMPKDMIKISFNYVSEGVRAIEGNF
ncbi:MAG: tRNA (adenosine(37)-N6)-threonylcarbamoyltransferase complex ATPase subunit type 1 TsaE [Candidatus Yonathbacteria bacterium RIFCSPLOWO2_01_FULL_47_33b]|uniref:tRNA threonylcarbamoyladenosine biosynthesis protein TsaE n=1 Tax=Candidatus Yonathbacteria bacterium RIFCSPLOWO2_01_FULL_47_33b TaxID=1802727 RepID=A0A1G2SG24_9BACT|nr:MAG: tRNA (adenosine(37)-N6)-threonylcarbamoyltransferase complex ATPase subunit type 1 TsaE [Candidatus Yonathbacteria bacterium RIFCSPLOWO2_01_FULL_47_33b]